MSSMNVDPKAASVGQAFSREDSQIIRHAMSNTPFSGDSSVPMPSTYGLDQYPHLDADDVVKFLEGLSVVLREHGERHEVLETEVRQLRAQRKAVRAFFGTEPQ